MLCCDTRQAMLLKQAANQLCFRPASCRLLAIGQLCAYFLYPERVVLESVALGLVERCTNQMLSSGFWGRTRRPPGSSRPEQLSFLRVYLADGSCLGWDVASLLLWAFLRNLVIFERPLGLDESQPKRLLPSQIMKAHLRDVPVRATRCFGRLMRSLSHLEFGIAVIASFRWMTEDRCRNRLVPLSVIRVQRHHMAGGRILRISQAGCRTFNLYMTSCYLFLLLCGKGNASLISCLPFSLFFQQMTAMNFLTTLCIMTLYLLHNF